MVKKQNISFCLIMLEFNMSTPVSYFVSPPRDGEKR